MIIFTRFNGKNVPDLSHRFDLFRLRLGLFTPLVSSPFFFFCFLDFSLPELEVEQDVCLDLDFVLSSALPGLSFKRGVSILKLPSAKVN